MRNGFEVFMRLLIMLMLTSLFMPLILLILVLFMINYMLMSIAHGESIIYGLKWWSLRLKQGILMNIDFILNVF